MDFKGCSQSIRKEIEAIRDNYLEEGYESGELTKEKKESNFSKFLFFFSKILINNNKAPE